MSDPLFSTLGLFIIDENQYPESWKRHPEFNIIGGGGSYAIIGGRFVSGPKLGKRVCGIIDKGSDFPERIQEEMESWGSGAIFRYDPNRLTSRGANIYGEDGVRNFVYRAPKKRIEGVDIVNTENLVNLRSFHFCCSVERCEETIDLLSTKAQENGRPKPLYVFEPFPEVCTHENLDVLNRMLHKVDVFSPNLNEAAALAGLDKLPTTEEEIKRLANLFLKYSSPSGGIALRCGELGCYILTQTVSIMLPAYHQSQSTVVDVTGGGNSFCGAFITALCLSGDWLTSGILANLASGCVIETLGMPKLDGEKWNKLTVKERLQLYLNSNKEILADFDQKKIDWM